MYSILPILLTTKLPIRRRILKAYWHVDYVFNMSAYASFNHLHREIVEIQEEYLQKTFLIELDLSCAEYETHA